MHCISSLKSLEEAISIFDFDQWEFAIRLQKEKQMKAKHKGIFKFTKTVRQNHKNH